MLEALAIMAFTTAAVAILRGRNGVAWFLIGGLLPVIGLILVNALPRVTRPVATLRVTGAPGKDLFIRITEP